MVRCEQADEGLSNCTEYTMVVAYCVPASPANPATPVDDRGIEVGWFAQKVDVGNYITHQVDPLHSCLRQK